MDASQVNTPVQEQLVEETRLQKFLDREEKYAPIFLRLSIASVWLWFGINQLLYPDDFVSWVPDSLGSFIADKAIIVLLNGWAEVILGSLMLVGLFTRLSSLILGLHMITILVLAVGYGAIGVRNFAIMAACFVIFLDGHDRMTLDRKIIGSKFTQTGVGKVIRKAIL